MFVKFKKLSETAITPQKANYNDAGFDLFADEDVVLAYGETKAVATNIALELPDGYMADVRPRSGLTRDTALRVQYGTVDAGFRGGIGIICENASHTTASRILVGNLMLVSMTLSGEENDEKANLITHSIEELQKESFLQIKKGDKIAQLVIQRIPDITLIEATGLNHSARGANGFGSTDLKEVEG